MDDFEVQIFTQPCPSLLAVWLCVRGCIFACLFVALNTWWYAQRIPALSGLRMAGASPRCLSPHQIKIIKGLLPTEENSHTASWWITHGKLCNSANINSCVCLLDLVSWTRRRQGGTALLQYGPYDCFLMSLLFNGKSFSQAHISDG